MTLDPDKIIPDRSYLDESIVGARNRIAHGDYFTISDDQLVRAIQYVLEIMRRTHPSKAAL